ncbi:MAG TPA: hypothetical protein VMK42_08115 [Anaeromyxobacteraceae bacterium]|nr:hypothetical protein [Anaeromyxobacteraceae bacterium]
MQKLSLGRPGALALTLLATAACGSRSATTFPPGISNNLLNDQINVAWPTCPPLSGSADGCASDSDLYPEYMATEISGTGSGYGWAHGRGYLKSDISAVWNKLQLDQGVVQLSFYPERNQSSCSAGVDVEQGYDVSFETHETPNGAIQSHYDFAVTFREGVMEGSEAAPTEIGVVYEKTWGATSPGVQILVGSIVFAAVTTDVTSIEMIRHLEATDTNGGTQTLSWITDYYSALKADLAGTPPPDLCAGAPP